MMDPWIGVLEGYPKRIHEVFKTFYGTVDAALSWPANVSLGVNYTRIFLFQACNKPLHYH